MHDSAMEEARVFVSRYVSGGSGLRVADIGSRDVNGSLRPIFARHDYVGFDIEAGQGVDVIVAPEQFDIPDASFDCVVSANCLEHTRRPWVVAAEMVRICKPDGLVFILIPANQSYHAYPIDCWRCYTEGMRGLMEHVGLEVLDVHDSNGRDTVGIGRKGND